MGSHVLNALINRGYKIKALRREGSISRIPVQGKVEWLTAGLEQIDETHLKGHDVLIHLAAHSANVPYDHLERCLFWNNEMSLRLVEAGERAGIQRFLVAGTCFEYGLSGERYEFIPTCAPLEPTQSYPISKAASAVSLMGWARLNKQRMSYHRLFQVFGEGEPANRLWPALRTAAIAGHDFPMTKGEQVRDFIAVEDVADHFIDALGSVPPERGSPEVYHVATGKPTRIIDFANNWWKRWAAVGTLLPGAIPYRNGEVMRYVPERTPLLKHVL